MVMINQKENYKNHIISGFFIFVSLLLLMLFIMLLGKENSLFKTKIEINTIMKNAHGLRENSAVTLKGIKIGHISKITITEMGKINIGMNINSEYIKWIKIDSMISIKTHGVLGDKFLEINGGSNSSNHLNENDYIKTEERGQLDRIISKGEDVLVTATKSIFALEQILSKIPPERVESIVIRLDSLLETLNRSSKNIAAIDIRSMNKLMKNSSTITNRIKEGPGTLNGLIYDRTLYDDLRKLFGGSKRNSVLNYFIRESIENSEKNKK
jgi:phospholipid/cholesterol/gamma-HCH transport system substrate-binding protein